MTTYLLLTLHSDGRTVAYELEPHEIPLGPLLALPPFSSGHDRGHYTTYEIAGRSVDVCMTEERK